MNNTSPPSCLHYMRESLMCYWRTKLAWSGVCLAGFILLYFTTQHVELMPTRKVPTTAIDDWVGFDPRWTVVYESLWLLLPIGPWLARSRVQIRQYLVGFALMCAVAFPVFLLWPVEAPRPAVVPDHTLYRLLVSVDGTRNSIPSMHAALGLYTLLVARHVLKQICSPLNLKLITLSGFAWLIVILYATLATAQHWFIDLPPGLLLAMAAYYYVWYPSGQHSEGDIECATAPDSSPPSPF